MLREVKRRDKYIAFPRNRLDVMRLEGRVFENFTQVIDRRCKVGILIHDGAAWPETLVN